MATSSRQSALFGVQDWKKFYQTYRDADFQSYDYETLRKSFIDYLTQNYPESFNDYIESSEFIALLDVIAYMGQALAFRVDLNARENFIDTAERRDSVIKLANLVGYTPKRNLASQGLLKVTQISTTESVLDINGTNLSNTVVIWNDSSNSIWQEQFNAILNAALVGSQRVGKYGNSQNILGVRTDEYTINIPNGSLPVVPFDTVVDGNPMVFEIVNVSSLNSDSLYELPPVPTNQLNILYRNDKLGYGSPDTGFFFYFKQGSLQEVNFAFSEQIENNFQLIDIQNVNNDDTWLFQLNNAGTVVSVWTKVENIFAPNTSQNENTRKLYTVLSRSNDQITYLFGDGAFSEIPVGTFRAYVRTSNGLTYTITPDEMSGVVVTMNYISRTNRTETLTFTLNLQHNVTNALQKERLLDIKERAPSRYYTQNRMVNGEDYNNFPFTAYSSIVKSKAVNRTSTGISRNQDLIDPTGKYSSTVVFGDDGALYLDEAPLLASFPADNNNIIIEFFSFVLPKILSSNEVAQYYHNSFKRYTGKYSESGSTDNKIYWKRSTLSGGSVTGYFYILNQNNVEVPIAVGSLSTSSARYINNNSLIKFIAPAGKYFDKSNRLLSGTPTLENEGRSYIWVKVDAVVGDGANNGLGNLVTGTGPVILNKYVPSGCYLDTTVENSSTTTDPEKFYGTAIIPALATKVSKTIFDQVYNFINLKVQYFRMVYDNTVVTNNWSLTRETGDTFNTIAIFEYIPADDRYQVTVKSRAYNFASVKKVKFLIENKRKIFDVTTNSLITDQIIITKVNSNPTNSVNGLGVDYRLYAYDQDLNEFGIPKEYSIRVSMIDSLTGSVDEPDFFTKVTGSNPEYVFFGDSNLYDSENETVLLNKENFISSYNTLDEIEEVKYEYPPATIFYAKTENKFYISSIRPLTNPPILDLTDISNNYYSGRGRNNVKFQYTKNTAHTMRINPAVTNIIDLYLVTQSYYNQYQSWVNDSTNTILEPVKPTIDELTQTYSNLQSYKMLSDNIVLHSVSFKPIFGSKSEYSMRGTIKVVKNPATIASESQIRSSVLSKLNEYFTLDKWDFGDTFYFSELSAFLHVELAGLISSVVVVPVDPTKSFGDLYEIKSAPNEIFVNGASINDITVINSLTGKNLQQR